MTSMAKIRATKCCCQLCYVMPPTYANGNALMKKLIRYTNGFIRRERWVRFVFAFTCVQRKWVMSCNLFTGLWTSTDVFYRLLCVTRLRFSSRAEQYFVLQKWDSETCTFSDDHCVESVLSNRVIFYCALDSWRKNCWLVLKWRNAHFFLRRNVVW